MINRCRLKFIAFVHLFTGCQNIANYPKSKCYKCKFYNSLPLLYRQSLPCTLCRLRFLAWRLFVKSRKYDFFSSSNSIVVLYCEGRATMICLSVTRSVRSSVHLLLTFHWIIYWYKVQTSFWHCVHTTTIKKTKLNEEKHF